jgi:hypothetical protein
MSWDSNAPLWVVEQNITPRHRPPILPQPHQATKVEVG